jgi:GAF domain-containing protein/anti-sigma regulatory factor (Ser/Thr protein kinase)
VLGSAGAPTVVHRAEQLRHIHRLNDPRLSELDLEALLDEVLIRIRDALGVDTVAILLYDDEREMLVARAAKGLEQEVEEGVRIPVGKGFAGRIAAERVPIFIADVSQADIVNPILRELGLKSLLGVPLIVEGEVIGVLHVGTLQPREFGNDDAAVLQLAAGRIAPGIERARLYEALAREHRVAVALQRSLLPERMPDLVGVGVATRYLPARDEVGGDWYDVVELAEGKIGIAIGDVAGHGARAAALMGQLRTAMRAYALDGRSPAEVLKRMDRLLQTIRARSMATAVYGLFDPERSVLRFATAGHPPPLLVPASGEPRYLAIQPAPPLGTLAYPSFDEEEVTLAGGDIVLLFTDGLIEVRGESLGDGLDRLREVARSAPSPEELCQQVTRKLVPPGGAGDDVAVVALQNASVSPELLMEFPATPAVLSDVRQVLRRWLNEIGAGSDDVSSITLACGEACANAIEHAYSAASESFAVEAKRENGTVLLKVRDAGSWRPPRGTNRGRGLTIMEASMDELEVRPTKDGTEVLMRKRLSDAS